MIEVPAPLTPSDCDLRGYDFMPLFGHRLFSSDFYTAASDAEFRTALRLWWSAWQQCPAGSLPDDDAALCRLADLGRDVKGWRRLRERALHGFVKCSDGRLYHPLLAAEAMRAWDRRRKERDRKARTRAGQGGDDPPDIPRDSAGLSAGQDAGQAADADADVRAERREENRREEDIREEQELASLAHVPAAPARRARAKPSMEGFEEFWRYYPRRTGKGDAEKAWPAAVRAAGGDPEEIVIGLKSRLHLFDGREECRFVPYPARWLREKRWLDGEEPDGAPPPPEAKPDPRNEPKRMPGAWIFDEMRREAEEEGGAARSPFDMEGTAEEVSPWPQ